jgi:hypothetical protein
MRYWPRSTETCSTQASSGANVSGDHLFEGRHADTIEVVNIDVFSVSGSDSLSDRSLALN